MAGKKFFLIIFPLILLFYIFNPDWIWWVQILTFFSVVLFLGMDFSKRINKGYLFIILLFFMSTVFSVSKINSVAPFFFYILIFLLASYINDKVREILVYCFAAAGIVTGIISATYTIVKIFHSSSPFVAALSQNTTSLAIPIFGHAMYGVFVLLALPFILAKINQEKYFKRWILVYILLIISILFTLSKATISFGMLIIGFDSFVRIIRKKQRRPVYYLLSTILIYLFFSLWLLFGVSQSDWLKQKIVKPSVVPRLEYWRQSIEIIRNSPLDRLLVGYGLDSFFDLSKKYQIRPDSSVKNPHNLLLQLITETGIPATILLIGIVLLTIIRKWRYFELPEKISLITLVIYSFGASADIFAFPVLLLYFMIVNKSTEKDKIINLHSKKALFTVISLILTGFWLLYILVYSGVYFSAKSQLSLLSYFPYDYRLWSLTIDKEKKNTPRLLEISNLINNFSSGNTELKEKIIENVYNNKDFCNSFVLTRSYLLEVSFNIEMQNIFEDSYKKCQQNIIKEDLDSYFKNFEGIFNRAGENHFRMRNFFSFVSGYLISKGFYNDSIYWLDKLWQSDLKDPYAFMNIRFPERLEDLDRKQASNILSNYLLTKERTEYRQFYEILRETATEWLTLADWYDSIGEIVPAKKAYLMSMEIYPYDGNIYFIYDKFLRRNKLSEYILLNFQSCNKNFLNAQWCLPLSSNPN